MPTNAVKSKDNRIDMLGTKQLTKRLVLFALPLIASGVLQQSFNSVDVAVVGRYVGSSALAAVGVNGPVIGLIINLFIGIAVGANVVISNYIGRGDEGGTKRAVGTSMVMAAVSGIALMVIGLLVAKPILQWMGTPADVIDNAMLYLRIYSLGFPAMMVYNFGSAVLRSIGDTRRPFYCLMVGGLVNVVLNLIFVIVFGMGVEGVAIATDVANVVSALGVVMLLRREQGSLRVDRAGLRISEFEMSKILRIGVPAGLQGVVFSLSNTFIQSAINSFGADAMAGSAAALNYELYTYFFISSFGSAATAFISQNYGAGQFRQCQRIFIRCMTLSVVSCLLLNTTVYLNREFFCNIFTSGEAPIAYACVRIEWVLLFQFIACSYEIAGASMRAFGYSMTPTVITIIGTCLLRVCWVSSGPFSNLRDLLIIYPITWIVTGTAVVAAYIYASRRTLRHRS
jgi:putative MATE family efflux protein